MIATESFRATTVTELEIGHRPHGDRLRGD